MSQKIHQRFAQYVPQPHDLRKVEVAVIGSGMAGLTVANLLAQAGKQVSVLEQNYLPGGCTSSYWRKGFVFEAGATTIVGLDQGQPFEVLNRRLGLAASDYALRRLELPMQVRLANGNCINRYPQLQDWIQEAERVFGAKGQAAFWTYCQQVADWVWAVSTRQTRFPWGRWSDLWPSIAAVRGDEWRYLPLAFTTTEALLKRFGLHDNPDFRAFVDQQLVITAQAPAQAVNGLFGAAALCYTHSANYYADGGLMALVEPLVNKLIGFGSHLALRTGVSQVTKTADGYLINTEKGPYLAQSVVFAIPLNNALELYPTLPAQRKRRLESQTLPSDALSSAIQLGIAFQPHRHYEALHQQIHLPVRLGKTGGQSIFLSLSHPKDTSRSDTPHLRVASVSSHLHHPGAHGQIDKAAIVSQVLEALEYHDLIRRASIQYLHCSDAKDWAQWTGRKWGFVGGYPQAIGTKPWQMVEHRLDGKGAYICGDSTYPGQGIPGVVLSGLITADKWLADNGKS